MSLHSPLKLLVGGCSMITSCSVWLFEPSSNPSSAAITLDSDSKSKKPIKLDNLQAVDKLEGWKGQAIEVKGVTAEKYTDGTSIVLKFTDPNKKVAILSQIQVEITKFQVTANSTKEDYEKFDKSKINISLFKTPAWDSENKAEGYEKIDSSRVEELFQGNNEVRVKQLLLSLNHRIEWKHHYETDSHNMYYMNNSFAMKLDELKDLKIRHFNDFERLKSYVTQKTKTCVDDTRACFPHVDEIDYLEMDRKEYFEKAWNSQNT